MYVHRSNTLHLYVCCKELHIVITCVLALLLRPHIYPVAGKQQQQQQFKYKIQQQINNNKSDNNNKKRRNNNKNKSKKKKQKQQQQQQQKQPEKQKQLEEQKQQQFPSVDVDISSILNIFYFIIELLKLRHKCTGITILQKLNKKEYNIKY